MEKLTMKIFLLSLITLFSVLLISGPALGGFLLGWLHWRSIFYVRIPLGFIVLVLGIIFLKPDKRRAGKIHFDLLGTLFISLGLACLIIGVNQLNRFGQINLKRIVNSHTEAKRVGPEMPVGHRLPDLAASLIGRRVEHTQSHDHGQPRARLADALHDRA